MDWYWVLCIAVVIFIVAGITAEWGIKEEHRDNGSSSIAGLLASILFVLIMIYDKL